MRNIIFFCLFITIHTTQGFSQDKSALPFQKNKKRSEIGTESTRGEPLSKEKYDEYTKLIEEGSTDERIAYELGKYHEIFYDNWFHDKAKKYFLIGAKQDSPRCLYELAANLTLRDDDMTDVESYDRLKLLAEKDYSNARTFYNLIDENIKNKLEIKRKGLKLEN